MFAAGDKIVTVARDGSRTANCGHGISKPIYCTAVYTATPRAKDGVLTWRRTDSQKDATSGFITLAMRQRAMAVADDLGLPYCDDIRHGMRCNPAEKLTAEPQSA